MASLCPFTLVVSLGASLLGLSPPGLHRVIRRVLGILSILLSMSNPLGRYTFTRRLLIGCQLFLSGHVFLSTYHRPCPVAGFPGATRWLDFIVAQSLRIVKRFVLETVSATLALRLRTSPIRCSGYR